MSLYLKIILFILHLSLSPITYAANFNQSCKNKKIRIYTKPLCSYCTKAKAILKSENIDFEEVKIENHILATWLYTKTKQTTVPYIFIEDEFIGGYNELTKKCVTKSIWDFWKTLLGIKFW
ncbi:MAG: glutaredoxin [Rickettsiaceae bacterium]|nr:glutaredoxin [Rickettsiaceae bacterium]